MRRVQIMVCILMATGLLMGGCASRQAMNETFGDAPPLKTWEAHPKQKDRFPLDQAYLSDGSLVTKGKVNNSLYADFRARHVNDMVTIIVKESASSSDDAKAENNREWTANTKLTKLFGLKDDISDLLGVKDPSTLLDMSSKADFKGKGKNTQQTTLETRIAALVIEELPNGNLVIEGRRDLFVNGERKVLAIRGVIRPQDIAPDNTVSSEYVANAQIIYQGEGIVSQSQQPGLFTKLLLFFWPF